MCSPKIVIYELRRTKLIFLRKVHAIFYNMQTCVFHCFRLRELANHLQHGEVPIAVLQKALQYAACVLDTVCVDDSRYVFYIIN